MRYVNLSDFSRHFSQKRPFFARFGCVIPCDRGGKARKIVENPVESVLNSTGKIGPILSLCKLKYQKMPYILRAYAAAFS